MQIVSLWVGVWDTGFGSVSMSRIITRMRMGDMKAPGETVAGETAGPGWCRVVAHGGRGPAVCAAVWRGFDRSAGSSGMVRSAMCWGWWFWI